MKLGASIVQDLDEFNAQLLLKRFNPQLLTLTSEQAEKVVNRPAAFISASEFV
jgi:hypothetical protein